MVKYETDSPEFIEIRFHIRAFNKILASKEFEHVFGEYLQVFGQYIHTFYNEDIILLGEDYAMVANSEIIHWVAIFPAQHHWSKPKFGLSVDDTYVTTHFSHMGVHMQFTSSCNMGLMSDAVYCKGTITSWWTSIY